MPSSFSRRRALPLAAVVSTVGLVAAMGTWSAAASPASTTVAAATPTTQHCFGKVKRVEDGDTVDVRLTKTCKSWDAGHVVVVRNAGIQTTEHHDTKPNAAGGEVYECWAKPAQDYASSFMPAGTKVRLSFWHITVADEQTATGAKRYFMYVDALKGGKWVDFQASELRAGLAMWKPEAIEQLHNADYAVPYQQAMRAGAGIFSDADGTHPKCGAANQPGAQIQAWIGWKTNGRDTTSNADEEFFKLRNAGATAVDLSGWSVRDAGHKFNGEKTTYFTFKPGTVLQPGDVLTLFPTNGTDSVAKLTFFNNRDRLPFYANAPMGGTMQTAAPGVHVGVGQAWPGAANYLLDPQLNFRAWAAYPCVVVCSSSPMPAPTVDIKTVNVGPVEEVVVQNTSSTQPADITGLVLDYNGFIKELPPGQLPAAGVMTVHIVKTSQLQPDTMTDAYWGHDSGYNPTRMLSNDDGSLWLRTADDVTVDFNSWGNGGTYDYTK